MVETVITDHDTETEPIVIQSGWSFVVARTGDNPEAHQLLIGNVNLRTVFRTLGIAIDALMEDIRKQQGIPKSLMFKEFLEGMEERIEPNILSFLDRVRKMEEKENNEEDSVQNE